VGADGGGVEGDGGDEAGAGPEDAGEFVEEEGLAGQQDQDVEGEIGEHGQLRRAGLDGADAAFDTGGAGVMEGREHGIAGGGEDCDFGALGGEPVAEGGAGSAVEKNAAAGERLGGEEELQEFGASSGGIHRRGAWRGRRARAPRIRLPETGRERLRGAGWAAGRQGGTSGKRSPGIRDILPGWRERMTRKRVKKDGQRPPRGLEESMVKNSPKIIRATRIAPISIDTPRRFQLTSMQLTGHGAEGFRNLGRAVC
jgi:hypothetical protein